MRKISSSLTFFYKWVFPAAWFGVLAIIVGTAVPAAFRQQDKVAIAMSIGVTALLTVIGYVVMRMLIWDMVDEVYRDDDELIVRWRGEEDRFPVANILNVNATVLTNPERITLTLREPCRFGEEIVFSPPLRLGNFTRHPLAKELVRLASR